MHKTSNWNDFNSFLKVALPGSLKAGAEALDVNHSTVYRRINALEKEMDARLFERLKSGDVLISPSIWTSRPTTPISASAKPILSCRL